MIGIITLAFFISWFWIANKITRSISGKTRFPYVIIYVMILALPFLDEIIGRIQFQNLCNTEAKVWVSPTASEVIAAREKDTPTFSRQGFIFPIREQSSIYVDAHTGMEFYKYKAFHTPGGWIMRSGLNLGNSSSCWPKKWGFRENGIDIDLLLKNGEALESSENS
jgi:hypothetical protein